MRRFTMLSFALTLALTPAVISQIDTKPAPEPTLELASFVSPVMVAVDTVVEVTEALDDLQQAEVMGNQEEARLARQAEVTRRQAEVAEQERLAAEAAAAEAAAEAERRAKAARAPSVASGSVWDRLAQCESGGNWSINTGNGYYGGLQFNLQTWQAYGGTGYPHQHSRETQIAVAERLRAARGFQPWPACSRKLGLR